MLNAGADANIKTRSCQLCRYTKLIQTRNQLFSNSSGCSPDLRVILQTLKYSFKAYFIHQTTHAYLSLFICSWFIQKNLGSDPYWANDSIFSDGFPPFHIYETQIQTCHFVHNHCTQTFESNLDCLGRWEPELVLAVFGRQKYFHPHAFLSIDQCHLKDQISSPDQPYKAQSNHYCLNRGNNQLRPNHDVVVLRDPWSNAEPRLAIPGASL